MSVALMKRVRRLKNAEVEREKKLGKYVVRQNLIHQYVGRN